MIPGKYFKVKIELSYVPVCKNVDLNQESKFNLNSSPKFALGHLSVVFYAKFWRAHKAQVLFLQKLGRKQNKLNATTILHGFIFPMDLQVRETSMKSGKCSFFLWNETKDSLKTHS